MPDTARQTPPAPPDLPQFEWKDGILHINALLSRMRIRWQPAPLAEELLPGRKWLPFHPELRLFRPPGIQPPETPDAIAKQAAFDALRAQIPANLVQHVEPFASHQWSLLLLLAEQPRSIDLATSNPVLAYCLANNDLFRHTLPEVAAEQAVWYCHRKQRTILKWLGFPDTEAMARIMRKIQPDSVDPARLCHFRAAVTEEPSIVDRLCHAKQINGNMLEFLINSRLRDLATPRLLKSLETLVETPGTESPADRLFNALDMLKRFDPRRQVRPFTTMEQLVKFSTDIDGEYQAHMERCRLEAIERERQRGVRGRRLKKLKAQPFQDPPIPGTLDIIPLQTPEALLIEGIHQDNCVGSFDKVVRSGKQYIYKVLRPERATLAIKQGLGGHWDCSQLLGARNHPVKAATHRAIAAWLAQHSISV